MIMRIDRPTLIQAMKLAALAIEQRNAIPILGYMGIRSVGDKLILTGTDLDMTLEVEIAALSSTSMQLALADPHRVAQALQLGEGAVEIEEVTVDKDARLVAMRSGALDLQISRLPWDDFPQLIGGRGEQTKATLSAAHIDSMLRVIRACSTEETRYYLNGLYMHLDTEAASTIDSASLRLAATDGHRLYYTNLAIEHASALGKAMPVDCGRPGMIIPRKVFDILKKLRKQMDGDITFGIAHGSPSNRETTLAPVPAGMQIYFAFTTRDGRCKARLTSKLIDGTFPNYSRVIPSGDLDKIVSIKRAELWLAVRRISGTLPEKVKGIKLTFQPDAQGADRLIVSCRGIEGIRAASTFIAAKTTVKTPFDIGFNGKYLADICDVASGEELLIETSGAGAPSRISSPDNVGGIRTVLMPMRI
jgi:DNA polymerase-3 subunit beta